MRETLVFLSYRLLGALVGPLPPGIGYWLARGAGRLLYRLSPGLRRVLTHNLRHVLGPAADEAAVQSRVQQACVNIAKGHYEIFRVSRLTADQIESRIQVEGWEHLEQAMEAGRGGVVFAAHLGNVEIVLQLPAVRGLPLLAVALHTKPERLYRYAVRLRTSHGVRLIPSDGPMLGLFRALKRGELVLLAADYATTDNTRAVTFFGSPTHLPEGSVRVALSTGAALLPASAHRMPDDSFLLRFEPPLRLSRTGDREADVAAGMAQVVAVLERHIGLHPEEWSVAKPIWPMDGDGAPAAESEPSGRAGEETRHVGS